MSKPKLNGSATFQPCRKSLRIRSPRQVAGLLLGVGRRFKPFRRQRGSRCGSVHAKTDMVAQPHPLRAGVEQKSDVAFVADGPGEEPEGTGEDEWISPLFFFAFSHLRNASSKSSRYCSVIPRPVLLSNVGISKAVAVATASRSSAGDRSTSSGSAHAFSSSLSLPAQACPRRRRTRSGSANRFSPQGRVYSNIWRSASGNIQITVVREEP